ncbi:MAG TPA: pyridoxal 5'-phosphate synthase glutaminase subunit PdxT [Acidimicrobiia bacterium]
MLALQGAFREHREVLDALGVDAVEVRTPEQLSGIDALFLPGGESTTITKLLHSSGLVEPLRAALADGLPVFGTCAGLIVLASDQRDQHGAVDEPLFGVLDVTVLRNGYGTQLDSFEAPLRIRGIEGTFPGVFIRAPVVESVAQGVEVLATHDGAPVLVRQGRAWAATFHPELSGDLRLHQRFLQEAIS